MRFRLVDIALAGAAIAIGKPRERYAHMDIGQGLSPRYHLGDPRPAALDRRENKCNPGEHQCVDVGFPDICCPNDRYCFINQDTLQANCCAIGRNCDEDCSSTAYYCPKTTTTGDTTTTIRQCCPRACTSVSFYRCEEAQGGGCCPYDNACENGQCVSTKSQSPRVTPLDEGCTTSQHRCDDLGGGCCNDWQHCTTSGTVAGCAAGNPSNTEFRIEPKSKGLSDGAKAGIGVGVVIGVALIIGAITYICLVRRRARTASQPSGDGDNVTEVTADSGPPWRGTTQDYSGPPAVPGPFTTETHGSEGLTRAVPPRPHGPNDIIAPVEIGSTGVHSAEETPSMTSNYGRPTPEASPGETFELYGSEAPFPMPSPPSQYDVSPPMPSPPSPGNKSPP